MDPTISVTPPPSDEELAAVVAAYQALWPRPAAPSAATAVVTRWRFSGRWWSEHPARRRARP